MVWKTVAGPAALLAFRGLLRMALWVLISTSACLTSGEAKALEPLNFVPARPLSVPLWSLLEKPSELEIPSKASEFDDAVGWGHARLR